MSACACAVAAAAAMGLPLAALAETGQGRFSVRELRGGAFLVSSGYSNALALETPEGVLLVDGAREEDAGDFLQVLDGHTGGTPVQVAYNTHWYWDHSGTNEALRERGARILAHENTRLWLGNEFDVHWRDKHFEPRPAQALPSETFYETHSLRFGGEQADSGLLFQAITDGDIYVKLREHNILAAGAVVADGTWPLVDPATGGWIGGLVDAQARLLELADEQTLIIPASGAVQDRAALEAQHAVLAEMKERIFEFARQGKGPREMLAEGVAEGFEQWGDPTQFVLNIYPGLGRHYRDVDGVV